MNFWESFVIGAAASAIRTFVKNPQVAAKYRDVLLHIYYDLGSVLAANGWLPNGDSGTLPASKQ